jgi:hypothetical protein
MECIKAKTGLNKTQGHRASGWVQGKDSENRISHVLRMKRMLKSIRFIV